MRGKGSLVLAGYVWVSHTEDSVYEPQRQNLSAAGVLEEHIFEDLAQGRKQDRPALRDCLHRLNRGDTLVVWRLDRLAGTRADLLMVLEELAQRGIAIKVLEEKGAMVSSERVPLPVVVDLFSAFIAFEADILRVRTAETHDRARSQGKQVGGRRKMTGEMLRQAIAAMADPEVSATQVAQELGITRATLYRYLNGDGTPKPAARELLEEEKSE